MKKSVEVGVLTELRLHWSFPPRPLGPSKSLEIELSLREGEWITVNEEQIRSLLVNTASFTRSASGFLRYPLFLIDFGRSQYIYKQESLTC